LILKEKLDLYKSLTQFILYMIKGLKTFFNVKLIEVLEMESQETKSDISLQKMREVKRLKSDEDKRVGSEVFDTITLKTLYKLANQGYIHLLNGAISTGKEANVFKGADEDDNLVAVKIYRVTTSDFKKMQYYIQGDPRFNVRSNNKRQLINNWVLKEFKNLNRADEVGVRVPKPIIAKNNVLVMEFIGDANGTPARLLRQSKISNPKYIADKIIDYVKKLYKDAEIVHGDLSGFNILIENDEPVIIDLSQGMVVDHPMARELLNRDIDNLIKDFKKMGIEISKDEIKRKIMDL
jgi:RIO kinase 1